MIRHQLDFVLALIDHQTDQAVSGVSRFWLNDRPIKATKVVGEYFIFSNFLNDYTRVHVKDASETLVLRWENDHYMPLSVDARSLKHTERAMPSRRYPLKQDEIWVLIKASGAASVYGLKQNNRIKYHLMMPTEGENLIALAASQTCRLEGRCFYFTEGDQSEVVKLTLKNEQIFSETPLKYAYTEAAEIVELIDASKEGDENFVMIKELSEIEKENKALALSFVVHYEKEARLLNVTVKLQSEVTVVIEE